MIIALSPNVVELEGVARSGQNVTRTVLVVLYGSSGERWTARVDDLSRAWLFVSPTAGEDDATLQISASPAKLAKGTYSGLITISVPSAQNSPQVIRVTFNVRDPVPASMQVTTASLTFTAVAQGPNPPAQPLGIIKRGDTPLNWRVAVSTSSGGNWLAASPLAGADTGVVEVRVETAALTPGVYSGAVTIIADGAAGSPARVPVTFTVERPVPVLRVSSTALDVAASGDNAIRLTRPLAISNGGAGTLNWTVSAATLSGGPWLSVAPASGTGAGSITVAVDAANLPGGVYVGRLTLTANGAANSPLHVTVTLTVERPKPAFSPQGVVNAASLQAGPLAPGQIVSIYGSRLGPWEGVAFALEPGTNSVGTELGGVSVTFDSVRAPLLYASYGQVNFVVPFEVADKASSRMVVTGEGMDAAEMTVPIARAAPGVFTIDGSRAAALNADSTLNTPANRAPAGSVIQLFLTGQGAVNPKVATGQLAPAEEPFARSELPVSVSVNALDAQVLYAGLAPGLIGMTQLNVEIPPQVGASERVRVVVRVGEFEAPPVFISVR